VAGKAASSHRTTLVCRPGAIFCARNDRNEAETRVNTEARADSPWGAQWGLQIEPPLRLADADRHPWDESADLVVVGLGGAGVAAALEGVEQGLKVIALDRYDGGGSSAAVRMARRRRASPAWGPRG